MSMPYTFLGNTGLKISRLGFGAFGSFGVKANEELSYQLMKKAFDSGINFFDNAEIYGDGEGEIMMGKVIKRLNVRRSALVIVTKIFWGPKLGGRPVYCNDFGLSRKHIIEGLKDSLERLQLDYVDVVLAHRPDIHTPMEETVRAFNYVIDQGMAMYWGTSEWSAEQIREANIFFLFYEIAKRLGLIGPIGDECLYNCICRSKFESEYDRLFKEIHMGSIVFSPLAYGLLTGKYANGIPEDSRLSLKGSMETANQAVINGRFGSLEYINDVCKKLKEVSERLGCSLPQLCLAWVLKNDNVSVMLLGASKVSQLEENIKCLEVLPKLTDDVMNELDKILNNKPAASPDCRTWNN